MSDLSKPSTPSPSRGTESTGAARNSHRFRVKLEELIGLDTRSLALFRVGMALILLADLGTRAWDLRAFYSDAGVLSRVSLLEWRGEGWSLHLISGSVWAQGLLFVTAALLALAMLVGYRSGLATAGSWLLLASLHGRNPAILHGGDNLLRVMMFWAMFVPLAHAGSIDSARRAVGQIVPRRIASVGSLALALQLCFMYWFTGALKWHPSWVEDGTAVYQALSLDQLTTRFGQYLLEFPALLPSASYATVALELIGPALLFVPFYTGYLRIGVVMAFIGFHLVGLAPALALGNFPWVCAVAWTLFLPSIFWDRLENRLQKTRPRLQVFDGLQPALSRLPRRALPSGTGIASSVVAAFLLIHVTLWNLRTLDFAKYQQLLPETANWVVETVRLDQYWNLFAPFPSLDDGWYVLPGQVANGDEVDVFTGQPVSWQKPEVVSKALGNERWRKYLMNLWLRGYRSHRRMYGEYLCRQWNHEHSEGQRLESFKMYYMLEWTTEFGEAQEPQPNLIWTQVCVDS